MIITQKHLEFYGNMALLALVNNGDITDFNEGNTASLIDLKEEITGQPGNNGTKNGEIMVPLKYLSNFWRVLDMSLINCKINLDLKWSKNCIIVATNVVKPQYFQ